ncbi:MAG TPA: hypothetical protein VIB49_08465 [Thermoplasmata archaeon]|jgi:uncharacterized membrane protein
MVSYLAAAEFLHVLFGVMWVGTAIYAEAVLFPQMHRAKTVGDLRVWLGIQRRTGQFQSVSSLLTLASGLAYMFLDFGADLVAIWADPSGMLVLISLILVLLAAAISFGWVIPTSVRLGKSPLPAAPGAPIPAQSTALLARIQVGVRVIAAIIVVVLFLMVVAGQGGF